MPKLCPFCACSTDQRRGGGSRTGSFAFSSLASANAKYAHSGKYGAQLGGNSSLRYMFQSLTTTPGGAYTNSFRLDGPDGKSPNEFLVSWGGAVL